MQESDTTLASASEDGSSSGSGGGFGNGYLDGLGHGGRDQRQSNEGGKSVKLVAAAVGGMLLPLVTQI